MVFFFLAPNVGLPIRPVDARLQNESVDASDEHDASRESPERNSSSCRRIPAGTLSEGSNVGTPGGFFSSSAAVADAKSLPGLGEGFRPRVADIDLVLLPADRGSESPPPEAGDSRPLVLDPDIATKSPTFSTSPKPLPRLRKLSRKRNRRGTAREAPNYAKPSTIPQTTGRIPNDPQLSPQNPRAKP